MHYSLRRRRPLTCFFTDSEGRRWLNCSERSLAPRRALNLFDRFGYAKECVYQKKIRNARLGMMSAILRFRVAVGDLLQPY